MDLSRYAELFLTESRDHVSAINHALLRIERSGPEAESVDAIFRAVHTIKGMSATMGYARVAELSHEMETVLDGVRDGVREVDVELMDVLFDGADALERSIELSVAGREEESDIEVILARLRALPAGGAGAAAAAASAVGAPPPEHRSHGEAGRMVRIGISSGAPLRGVRAFMAVQRARELGDVTAISPPLDALQREEFAAEFTLRIVSAMPDAELERALAVVGDVESVVVEPESAPAAGSADNEAPAPEATAVAALALAEPAVLRQQRHVRIDLRRLDTLMNLIGELVITRGRLAELARGIAEPALDEAVTQASRLIADLQDEIMTSRMVPVWQVFDRFPRLVRDAARALGKEVELSMEGREIELDRSMLDEIGDPVVHLLRNAVDHGIESPAARAEAGKPRKGKLVLSATRDRTAVLITVSDDGRGIDRDRVLRRARELGLADQAKTELSDEELIRLISRPGFSTAERVTDISGRGVGMDTVQNRIRALGGSVEVRTVPGAGTTVVTRLPVTLAIVRALLARVGEERYALPMTHVSETVHLDESAVRTVRGHEALVLREEVLPLIRLRQRVQLPPSSLEGQQVVVLEVAERRAGLVVDELTGQQEIVVKQFDAAREAAAIFSGATILGDGAPALIVDVGSLL